MQRPFPLFPLSHLPPTAPSHVLQARPQAQRQPPPEPRPRRPARIPRPPRRPPRGPRAARRRARGREQHPQGRSQPPARESPPARQGPDRQGQAKVWPAPRPPDRHRLLHPPAHLRPQRLPAQRPRLREPHRLALVHLHPHPLALPKQPQHRPREPALRKHLLGARQHVQGLVRGRLLLHPHQLHHPARPSAAPGAGPVLPRLLLPPDPRRHLQPVRLHAGLRALAGAALGARQRCGRVFGPRLRLSRAPPVLLLPAVLPDAREPPRAPGLRHLAQHRRPPARRPRARLRAPPLHHRAARVPHRARPKPNAVHPADAPPAAPVARWPPPVPVAAREPRRPRGRVRFQRGAAARSHALDPRSAPAAAATVVLFLGYVSGCIAMPHLRTGSSIVGTYCIAIHPFERSLCSLHAILRHVRSAIISTRVDPRACPTAAQRRERAARSSNSNRSPSGDAPQDR